MKAGIGGRSITLPDIVGKPTLCAALILLISITALWPTEGLAMKGGVGKRDITFPELLNGTPEVHDPLFARALVLDDGDNAVAIVCLDLGHLFFPEVRERIREQLGIERVLVNCSHTHSDWQSYSSYDDPNYGGPKWKGRAKVGKLIYEAVEEAYAERVPVSLRAGRAPVGIGSNRYGDAFTQDVVPWVNVLEARTEDGRTLAVLFETATHTVMSTGADRISADFPGYAVKRINEELGDEVMPMFAQGCAGNINPPSVGAWYESSRPKKFENTGKAGRELGDAVLAALRKTTEIKADKLTLRSKTIMLPCHVPAMELWEEAGRRIRSTGEVPPREGWGDDDSTWKYMEVVKGMIAGGERPEREFEINAVMLGSEWCLVTLPGEVFSEYELWVNAFAPFEHSMVFAYTNAYADYIPTDRALALGAKTPIVAESECMEAGGWPGFFHGMRIDGAYLSYAVGIEGLIHEAIASLWAE